MTAKYLKLLNSSRGELLILIGDRSLKDQLYPVDAINMLLHFQGFRLRHGHEFRAYPLTRSTLFCKSKPIKDTIQFIGRFTTQKREVINVNCKQ